MPEFGGLQIEVRCVRCGRLPTADITLYEMQNHLYICNICRLEAERKGRQIAWVEGVQAIPPLPSTPSGSLLGPTSPLKTHLPTSGLPPDSLFAVLELSLDIPVSKIREAIKQQMSLWMKKPDSAEKKAMIAWLREWMEKIQGEQAFETYRENLRALAQREGSTLSVGGRSVLTAQEFLDACEKSREGWADGERYLRTGRLRQWILFQLEDRDLATEARRYQTWISVSDFRALNEMLYCLVPERPFRLYSHERWQAPDTVPSAATPAELAMLCDIHWSTGEEHLYHGSMVFWLEHSRGIQGLRAYFDTAIAGYAMQMTDRGVGLELLLERAVPTLPRPKLVVDFDGNKGSYTLKAWDREIPHKSITVTVMNITRGFTSVDLALQPRSRLGEPDWITMYTTQPVALRGRPGAGMPDSKAIALVNLQQLKRGHTYRRELNTRVRGDYGQVAVQQFPISLRPMRFFEGLRGKLWLWGLRGNIPGLVGNFVAGVLLSLFPFLLIPAIVPQTFFTWYDHLGSQLTLDVMLQTIVAGLVHALHFTDFGLAFPLMVGAVLGFVGFWVGIGKGHTDYAEKRNASGFRKGAFWLSVFLVVVLLELNGGDSAFSAMFQSSANNSSLNAIYYLSGAILAGLLIFLIACILASIHYRLEKHLRKRYQALLYPTGRQ